MSPPGRPEGESLSAQREGRPLSAHAAQPLERAWLALASGALVVAAACALVVAVARAPAVGSALGLQAWFAPALVVHVVLATIVWLLGVGAAQWVSIAPPNRFVGGSVLALAAAGALALPATLVTGAGAQLNNYLPLLDHALFRSGLTWFALALVVVVASASFNARRGDGDPATFALRWGLLPAWLTAAVLALSVAGAGSVNDGERLFWAPGHSLQFVYTALMVAAWIRLSAVPAERVRAARVAVLLTVLPALVALVPFALHAPDSAEFRHAFTLIMAFGSWPGPLLAALLLMRSAPVPVRLAFTLFALGAGIGVAIDGETTTVPAHYHGTVGAATLTAMAIVSTRLGIAGARRDSLPWLYFAGFALIVAGLAIAGGAAMPRKLPIGVGNAVATSGLALMSLGAAAAIAAVFWFGTRVARALLVRAPAVHRARSDRRPQAVALTALSVVVLGAIFAWSVEPRRQPDAHAAEVRLRFDQGVVMLHARQYDHAATAFHRVLTLAPEMPEAYVNLGFALLGLNRHREAGDFFTAAIALKRDQMNAYYGLAVTLEAAGDLRGAIGAMRAYVHRTAAEDPYRRKAEAALWEWETHLAQASAKTTSR